MSAGPARRRAAPSRVPAPRPRVPTSPPAALGRSPRPAAPRGPGRRARAAALVSPRPGAARLRHASAETRVSVRGSAPPPAFPGTRGPRRGGDAPRPPAAKPGAFGGGARGARGAGLGAAPSPSSAAADPGARGRAELRPRRVAATRPRCRRVRGAPSRWRGPGGGRPAESGARRSHLTRRACPAWGGARRDRGQLATVWAPLSQLFAETFGRTSEGSQRVKNTGRQRVRPRCGACGRDAVSRMRARGHKRRDGAPHREGEGTPLWASVSASVFSACS